MSASASTPVACRGVRPCNPADSTLAPRSMHKPRHVGVAPRARDVQRSHQPRRSLWSTTTVAVEERRSARQLQRGIARRVEAVDGVAAVDAQARGVNLVVARCGLQTNIQIGCHRRDGRASSRRTGQVRLRSTLRPAVVQSRIEKASANAILSLPFAHSRFQPLRPLSRGLRSSSPAITCVRSRQRARDAAVRRAPLGGGAAAATRS